jgi:hypothetical protein
MCGLPAACTSPSAAVQAFGHLQFANEGRSFEVAGPARLDGAVARLADQQRQPADLQLGAGADHQLGIACGRNQARADFDAVGVLQACRGHVDAGLVAGKFLDQRAPFGFAGQHLDVGPRGLHAKCQ